MESWGDTEPLLDSNAAVDLARTGVVTRRNGKVQLVPPDPAMYEDLIPHPFQPSD